MEKKSATALFAAALLPALFTAAAVSAAEPVPPVLQVPDTLKADGVPPVPLVRTEQLLPYENIRNARLSDWHPTERRILIQTRFAESDQVHEVTAPMGTRTQITFHRDLVNE